MVYPVMVVRQLADGFYAPLPDSVPGAIGVYASDAAQAFMAGEAARTGAEHRLVAIHALCGQPPGTVQYLDTSPATAMSPGQWPVFAIAATASAKGSGPEATPDGLLELIRVAYNPPNGDLAQYIHASLLPLLAKDSPWAPVDHLLKSGSYGNPVRIDLREYLGGGGQVRFALVR